MKINFCFEVVGIFRSEELWSRIEFAGVNLFDTAETVLIFGHTDVDTFAMLLKICSAFGDIKGGEFQ